MIDDYYQRIRKKDIALDSMPNVEEQLNVHLTEGEAVNTD